MFRLVALGMLVGVIALADLGAQATAAPGKSAAPAGGAGAAPAKTQDQFFDSNGVKIHYIVEGEGEPVLLIHGFSASIPTQWGMPGIIRTLSQKYKVIAYDNRGHGMSDKPHDPALYGNEMVMDAVRMLDHLKIEKAHVVGYSMGGFITMRLLVTHPERLLSAAPCGAGWGQKDSPRLSSMNELADSLEQGKGFAPLFNALTPVGQPKPSEERLANMNRMMTSMNDVQALAACIRGMLRDMYETEAELRANKVPTLAIIGEIDPIKANLDPMVGVMTNLDVQVIPGADHMTAFGKAEFVQGLMAHIEKNSAKTAAAKGGAAAGQ